MAHICIGEDADGLQERKKKPCNVIKQLDHWVEQLQVISKKHKILIRIIIARHFGSKLSIKSSITNRSTQFHLKL